MTLLKQRLFLLHSEIYCLNRLGDTATLVSRGRQALELAQSLGNDESQLPADMRQALGGISCLLIGKPDLEPHYSRSVRLLDSCLIQFERAVRADPSNGVLADQLAQVCQMLVQAHLEGGDVGAASPAGDRFFLIAPRLIETAPGRSPHTVLHLLRIAGLFVDQAPCEAATRSREALRVLKQVRLSDPVNQSWQIATRIRATWTIRQAGYPEEAVELLQEVLADLESAEPQLLHSEDGVLLTFEVWAQIGKCHIQLQQPAEATRAWERAADSLRQALVRDPEHSAYREHLARRCVGTARHVLQMNQPEMAQQLLDEAERLQPTAPTVRKLISQLRMAQAAKRPSVPAMRHQK